MPAPRQEPIAVDADASVAVPIEPDAFSLHLEVFEGPLQLLLSLIESRQLDVLTVPLADVADAYLAHLARHPVDPANLAEFVAVAAQLIELKSKRLLPGEPEGPASAVAEEPDEEALRRRLIEYRVLRDAAVALGKRDGALRSMRREPRESDLPEAPAEAIPPHVLADALERLAAIPEPEPPPPEVVPREVTIGQQIGVLLEALSHSGRVVLQAVLAASTSRTERTVTFMAVLELVRRRLVRTQQTTLFGPILVERAREGSG
jgi:segregation and condensation protein A